MYVLSHVYPNTFGAMDGTFVIVEKQFPSKMSEKFLRKIYYRGKVTRCVSEDIILRSEIILDIIDHQSHSGKIGDILAFWIHLDGGYACVSVGWDISHSLALCV